MKKVLFVCLGNICRSPLAEGIFNGQVAKRGLTDLVFADSAGTSSWNIGEPPHLRSQKAARKIGYDLTGQVCRQINMADFQECDLILGMDRENARSLEIMAGDGPRKAEIGLFLEYAGNKLSEVPDPWGKSETEYDLIASIIENAVPAILDRLMQQVQPQSSRERL